MLAETISEESRRDRIGSDRQCEVISVLLTIGPAAPTLQQAVADTQFAMLVYSLSNNQLF